MAQLLIRNLPEDAKAALRRLAHDNDRSMEAEARAILVDYVLPHAEDPVLIWLDAAETARHNGISADLPPVERSAARPVSFE